MKLAFLLATTCGALAACQVMDERPQTLAFITETILQPSCGTAECHSAMKNQNNYAFDSVAGAQRALATGLVACTVQGMTFDPCSDDLTQARASAGTTELIVVLTTNAYPNRMPIDQPLANKDIVFLEQWISGGADGYARTSGL
jgi:hypothetical protein